MPNIAIKANFLFSQDWSPVGERVVTPHDAIVQAGQDIAVNQGLVAVVQAGQDVAVDQGIIVEVDTGLDVTVKKGN